MFAIAPSQVQRGLIWAGTNDGKVWNTRDGGANWTDVTKNITGLPAWGVVSKIEPSNFDAGTAYVAVDVHLIDSREPLLYKTTDFGADVEERRRRSAVEASARLHACRSPRTRTGSGMLFAGTGHGFYYSLDDGATLDAAAGRPAAAPVTWVVVQKQAHDVVLSTYGRGLYILDDITPLEQPDRTTTSTDAAALRAARRRTGWPAAGGRSSPTRCPRPDR